MSNENEQIAQVRHIAPLRAFTAGLAILSLYYYVKNAGAGLGQTSFDDAYMFSRYAKHWLTGSGFSWNPADGAAYGVTSVSHLFIITALRGLTGYSDAMILTGTSFVAGLLSCLVLMSLGFLVHGNKWSRESWMPLLVIPSLLLVPPFRYHSLTGMETTLSLLANSLLACAVVGWSRCRSIPSLALCLLCGYLSFLTRPDNGLYALLLPPLFLVATDRTLWRYSMRYAVLFILILVLDLGFKQSLFGGVVPLSFFAKNRDFYQGYLGTARWNAMTEMLLFWSAALPFVLIIVAMYTRRTLARLVAIAVPVIATFGYFANVTQIMGYEARYYYPSLPFFVLGAFTALTSSSQEAARVDASRRQGRWRVLITLVVLLPVLSVQVKDKASSLWQKVVIGETTVFRPKREYRRLGSDDLRRISTGDIITLLERMPPGVVVAASEYGFIGSRLPDVTIIDLVGLHDRIIAHHGFSAEYVFSRKPDIIWFPHPDYSHAITEMLDSDTFALNYDYYPDAYSFGFALRKTSNMFAIMHMTAEEEFARVNPGLKMSDYRAEPVAPLHKE